ncbi:MAG TPA: DUF2325 domain-containing protein [Spirochaetota bacterium]|nr:DUF2325 domain-containing protein [Spirochaetota bacterium]HPI90402.1 DUF2325 domain-containing protein [Spirochaetota bacterium]HPR48515.1 DUF2325 domain-containing protein [Spirochaetota bacterium]
MNHPAIQLFTSTRQRKKIWDVSTNFHCSIIGTCLTLEEAAKILIKAGYPLTPKTSDYMIHGTAVSNAGIKNKLSSIIQKTLEYKFKMDIQYYSRISNANDLRNSFEESLEKGNIPGPYWAVMTHPCSTTDILNEAFGKIHMLSHLNGASRAGNIQRVNYLESKLKVLESEKSNYKKRIRELERNTGMMQSLSHMKSEDKKTISHYEQQIADLKSDGTMGRLFDELFVMANMYETEKFNKEKAGEKVKHLEKALAELTEKHQALKHENETLLKEAYYLEKELDSFIDKKQSCDSCSNDQCQCRMMTGKSVLYVGGKTAVIPHCRAIVEKNGGSFIHHDGGIEDNLPGLHNIIGKADAIFCPLDCVSHNASLKLKKLCRQHNKEFVMLRSSGLSSFSRELHEAFIHGRSN